MQTASSTAPIRINGITLGAGANRSAADWQALAHAELLRQAAVAAGLLPAAAGSTAPALTPSECAVLEAMAEAAVRSSAPAELECARYFEAHKAAYVLGQALHVRHILFAVTPGVNVQALAARAEQALQSLLRKNLRGKDVRGQDVRAQDVQGDAVQHQEVQGRELRSLEVPGLGPRSQDLPGQALSEDRFARLAAELSNCPSSAQGGDLGWIGPRDCAPELARALFLQKEGPWPLGLHPRLLHSRYGLHILEVLATRPGRQQGLEEVRASIAAQLALQSRAQALHRYMRALVAQAEIEGITLDGAGP